MNERELLEFIAAQVGGLTSKVDNIESKVDSIDTRLTKVENQLTTMEHDNKINFEALFDGYKQNSKLLEDIREEVARHEEVIIKRVK